MDAALVPLVFLNWEFIEEKVSKVFGCVFCFVFSPLSQLKRSKVLTLFLPEHSTLQTQQQARTQISQLSLQSPQSFWLLYFHDCCSYFTLKYVFLRSQQLIFRLAADKQLLLCPQDYSVYSFTTSTPNLHWRNSGAEPPSK